MPVLRAMPEGPVGRVAMIARWQPVHRIHAAILEAMCDLGERAIVGIGSVNRYGPDCPFTGAETAEMIRRALPGRDNYELLAVPDLGDGPRWAEMVIRDLGDVDLFLTPNAWVRDLLAPRYDVLHPAALLRPEQRERLDGTTVRRAIARGEDWRPLVPAPVADYLEGAGLVARFREEFGLAVLARE